MGPVVFPVTQSVNLPSVRSLGTARKAIERFPGENLLQQSLVVLGEDTHTQV